MTGGIDHNALRGGKEPRRRNGFFFFVGRIAVLLKRGLGGGGAGLSPGEENLRQLVERSPVVAFQLVSPADDTISVSYISNAAGPILGLSPQDAMRDTQALLDRIHPEDRNAFRDGILASARSLDPYRGLFRCLKEGHAIWIEAIAKPERMPDGGTLWHGVLIDVVERRSAEETALQANMRLQTVMDSIDAFIYIADMETHELLFVNQYGKEAWASDFVGRPCWEVLQGLDGPCPFCTNDRLLSEDGSPAGVIHWEFQNRRDGRWYDIRDSAIRWTDGRLVRLEVATDITERKADEEAHRQETARRRREADVVARIAGSPHLYKGAVSELADEITEAVSAALGIERVGIWLFDAEKKLLTNVDTYLASSGAHVVGDALDEIHYAAELEILKTSLYVDAHDALTDPRTRGYAEGYLKPNRIVSMLDAAIQGDGRNLGILCLEQVDKAHHWRDDEIVFACQIADQVALAIACRRRREAEEALRHSEAMYREIFNAVNDAIYVHDALTGEILDVNDAMLEMFGYTRDEVSGMTVGDISSGRPPYTQERAEELIRLVAAGSPQVLEWECRHKSGRLFWAEVSLKLGKIAGQNRVLVIERDITDRKQAQESLMRTQFAMDRARDSILWIDHDARIVYANDAACSSMGYTREELLSMRVFDIDPDFPPEQWEQHKEDVRRLKSMQFESRHRAKDGRIFPVEVSTNCFGSSDKYLACAFDRDITERKQAEQALQEREKRFRLLVQYSNDIIQIMDQHGVPSFVSGQITHILGYDRNDRIGISSLQDIHPDDRTAVEAHLAELSDLPGAVLKVEFRYRHKEGHWVDLEAIACNLLHDPDIQGIFLNIRDVTERRRAAQALAEKNRELEQLIYVASHDLRSPLVNVDGYGRELEFAVDEIRNLLETVVSLNAAQRDKAREALKEMADALHRIRGGTRQMDRLLKGLLTLSRSGRLPLDVRAIDMNVLVARVVSSLGFQIREAGVQLTIADLPGCRGDDVQVTQVFGNLLANAIKFLDPGRAGVVTVEGHIESGRSVYCIEDNGIGIAAQHQGNIFDLFHRLEPSRADGEGLGLTIVRQALVRLDGEVRVESEPGVGSRFYVSLPAVSPGMRTGGGGEDA